MKHLKAWKLNIQSMSLFSIFRWIITELLQLAFCFTLLLTHFEWLISYVNIVSFVKCVDLSERLHT
jgi:hypothetical protein